MFGRNICSSQLFVLCGDHLYLSQLIVNISMHNKLKKIDMVESLKSVE